MDDIVAVFAVSATVNPAAAYQIMVCLIKEYIRAKDDRARAVAAAILDSGFVFSVAVFNTASFEKPFPSSHKMFSFSAGNQFTSRPLDAILFHEFNFDSFSFLSVIFLSNPSASTEKAPIAVIYCPMRCTQQQGEGKTFPQPIDSKNFFDILNSEAYEHLFYSVSVPSDSFLDNRITNRITLRERRRKV